jgi:hypothetical protein
VPTIPDKGPVVELFGREDEGVELSQIVSAHLKAQNDRVPFPASSSEIRPTFRLFKPTRSVKPLTEIRSRAPGRGVNSVLRRIDTDPVGVGRIKR